MRQHVKSLWLGRSILYYPHSHFHMNPHVTCRLNFRRRLHFCASTVRQQEIYCMMKWWRVMTVVSAHSTPLTKFVVQLKIIITFLIYFKLINYWAVNVYGHWPRNSFVHNFRETIRFASLFESCAWIGAIFRILIVRAFSAYVRSSENSPLNWIK